MARIEEATLFRPDPKLQYPGRPAGGGPSGGGGGRGGDDDDGPQIALRERVSEAARSARRRKGLSFVVVMICGALTVLGAIFAPRNYDVESRVLVQATSAFGENANNQFTTPEQLRAQGREFEEQVMARDNIIEIVKAKNLVARWDEMRQPHRRLIDKINTKLGKPAPGDEEKFEALVANIEHRMKVWVDANTVTVKLEWSEPVSGRDIVEAAVKNFLDARYQSEVGLIPARLKIQEAFVATAHKELEESATMLVNLQKAQDPAKKVQLFIPQLPPGVKDAPIDTADPATKAKLENVRGQIAALQEAKNRRVAELEQQLGEKKQQLADGHPEMIALKQTLAAARQDPPQLIALREQEKQILQEIASAQKPAAPAPKPVALPRAPTPLPVPAVPEVPKTGPKSVQDAQVQFDAVTAKYQSVIKDLQELQVKLQTAEAGYRNRYRVVHPAEIPAAPKKPVALIAVAIGVLATIAAVLAVASLADRFSGIFFEPREVRDRLGLPVFATFT